MGVVFDSLLGKPLLHSHAKELDSRYVVSAGKASGQTVYGGTGASENLNLYSTSNASKGTVSVAGTLYVNEANGRVGVGTATPNAKIQVVDYVNFDDARGSTFLGYQAGNVNAAVSGTGIGYWALRSNTTGIQNIAIGTEALANNTTGSNNFAIGYKALNGNTTGSDNLAIGIYALVNNNGSFNFAFGYNALGNNTSGAANVGIGNEVLSQTNASDNVAIGFSALRAAPCGGGNVGIGKDVLYNAGVVNSVAIGAGAGAAYASQATLANVTLIGYRAGVSLQTGADNNVLIGYQAGDNITTGSNNIIIGTNIDAPSPTGSNQMYLGGVIYANLSSGNVGIGTTAPNSAAILELASTTKAFLPPKKRTQLPALPAWLFLTRRFKSCACGGRAGGRQLRRRKSI